MHTRSKSTCTKRRHGCLQKQTQRRRQEVFHSLSHTPTKKKNTDCSTICSSMQASSLTLRVSRHPCTDLVIHNPLGPTR